MGLFGWFRRKSAAVALALSMAATVSQVYAVPSDQQTVSVSERKKNPVLDELKKISAEGDKLLVEFDRIVTLLGDATKKKEAGDKEGYKQLLNSEIIPALERLSFKRHIARYKKIKLEAAKLGRSVDKNIEALEKFEKSMLELLKTLREETQP